MDDVEPGPPGVPEPQRQPSSDKRRPVASEKVYYGGSGKRAVNQTVHDHRAKVLAEHKKTKHGREWEKTLDYKWDIRFRNTLPDPPLGPHFLSLPLPLERYAAYHPTTLEAGYKWQLHVEPMVGVDIDIIDPRSYIMPKTVPELEEEDRAIIEWTQKDDAAAAGGDESLSKTARRKLVDTDVTWMRRTYYLSGDTYQAAHNFGTESKTQEEQRKKINRELEAMAAVGRLPQILQSFLHAERNSDPDRLKHQSDPTLKAEWVLPVLPDLQLWANDYSHVTMDEDPEEEEVLEGPKSRKRKRVDKALLHRVRKAVQDGDEFLVGSYLVPRDTGDQDEEEEDQEARGGEADESGGYQWIKDHKINIIDYKGTDNHPYLMIVVDPERQEASYVRLPAKIELLNLPRGRTASTRGCRVQRRAPTNREMRAKRAKLRDAQLVPEDWQADEDLGNSDDELLASSGGEAAGGSAEAGQDDSAMDADGPGAESGSEPATPVARTMVEPPSPTPTSSDESERD